MILPDHKKCREVLDKLAGDPALEPYEVKFIASNVDRLYFTPAQKEFIAGLIAKYQF